MKLFLIIPLIIVQTFGYSQSSDKDIEVMSEYDLNTTVDTNEVYQIVNDQPEFPGGGAEMMTYIHKELVYPEEALKNKKEGRIYINFIVERDGSISNVKNAKIKGRETDEALVKEAIRVVKNMPKWKPGKQKGETVRVKYTVPILFRISQ